MMKGLDRLAEELRQERAKASSALQDRARKVVEIEDLKQKLQAQTQKLQEAETAIEKLDEELGRSEKEVQSMSRNELELGKNMEHMEEKMQELDDRHKQDRQQKHELTLELENLRNAFDDVCDEVDSAKANSAIKEKLANDLKSQLEVQLRQHEQHEEKIFYLTDQIREKVRAMDSMQETVARVNSLEASDKALHQMCDDMNKELEVIYAKNTVLSNKATEDGLKAMEAQGKYDSLQEQLESCKKDRDAQKLAAQDWEKAHENLAARITAEKEAAELGRHQADIAKKEVLLVQGQLAEVTSSYEETCKQIEVYEDTQVSNKLHISALEQELIILRDLKETEEQLRAEYVECQKKISDLEEVQTQYMDLRKQTLRKEMESGVNELATSMNAGQRAQIHEEIISDLRQELSDMHNKNTRISKDLDDALRVNMHVERLEEDLRLMKETAQIVTAERNSANLSATEASERSLKSLHSRDILVRDLNRAESDALQAKSEVATLREEIAEERQKYRRLHVEKLGCERTSAEFVAISARSEAAMEEEKEKYTVSRIELERAKRTIKEQNLIITKLREKLAAQSLETASTLGASITSQSQGQGQGGSLSASQSQLSRSIADNKELEQLKSEIDALKHTKSIAQREIETLKQSVRIQREGFDNALAESMRLHKKCERLRGDMEELRQQKGFPKEWESEFAVHRLRSELDDTLSRWTQVDTEQVHKNQMIAQLQAELSREKEKAMVLQMEAVVQDNNLHMVSSRLTESMSQDVAKREVARGNLLAKLKADTKEMKSYIPETYASGSRYDSVGSQEAKDDSRFGHESEGGYRSHGHSGHSTPQRSGTLGRHDHHPPQSGGSLKISDLLNSVDAATKEHMHITHHEHSPHVAPPHPPHDYHHHPVTHKHVDSKEQLRRRREEREHNRNKALRGEAMYNASHGGGIAPAKLDLHQARQLLASKSKR